MTSMKWLIMQLPLCVPYLGCLIFPVAVLAQFEDSP